MLKRTLVTLALLTAMLAPVSRAIADELSSAKTEAVPESAERKGKLLPIPPEKEDVITLIWVLIIFVVLLMVLYPTAWRQVLNGLKAREQRIRNDIAQAEATRTKAEETLKDYNSRLAAAEERARELIAQATADGERLANQIRTRAQQEAEENRERALRDIESARVQAVREIFQQAATLATSVAEKILRRNLNADDQRDLVNESLEQMQIAGKR